MPKANLMLRGVATIKISLFAGCLAAMLAVLLLPASASAAVLPEKFTENTTLTVAGGPYTGTSTIEAGATVTVEPGVEMTSVEIVVKGTLIADGTAEDPITFSELPNDTILAFETGSGASTLDYIQMDEGGGKHTSGNSEAAITIKKASPTITNSKFVDPDYTAIAVTEGGAPEIGDNEILNSGGGGISYEAGSGHTGDINVYDNLIEGGTSGIGISASASSITGTTLGGNTVVGTTGQGLAYSGPDIPSDITSNTLSGNASNTIIFAGTAKQSSTWDDGPSKVEPNAVTIASGATVTVDPGVEMTNVKLIVKGALVADGTAEDPIVFDKAPADTMIAFEAGSGASVLDHVVVNKGGGDHCCGNSEAAITIKKASPTITNSAITNSEYHGIQITEGGAPEIGDNEILNSKGQGITYSASTGHTGDIEIYDNLIEGGTAGIIISASASSITGTTLGGNTITGTTGNGLTYSGPDIPSNITGNSLSGAKQNNTIIFAGTAKQSSTWDDGPSKVEPNAVTIASGATVTVDPGVEMTNVKLIVKGALVADGTAEDPIVFDKAPADTMIAFEAGSGASVLDHVVVNKGGGDHCCGNSEAAITIKKASPTITNSAITNSEYHGIYVSEGGSPEIRDNEILTSKGSGIAVAQGGSSEISDNTIVGSKSTALSYSAGSGNSGEIDIHDNFIEGGSNGISIGVSSSTVAAGPLTGNTVLATEGVGLSYTGADVPGGITDNTLIANKNNIIRISGTVAKSSTWDDANVKIEANGVTVAAGVTLDVNPGVHFISPKFIVKGTLLAEGTASKPIFFTEGPKRTTVAFEAGSGASVLNYVEIFKGGGLFCCGNSEAAITIKKASPTITNSTIANSENDAIKVTESGSPKIEWNRFRNNPGGGVSYSGTGNLSTPNNDWGCANGPKPAGCGDSVSSNVKWKPAVQLPELEGHCRGKESQCGEGADPVILATGQLSYSHRDLLLTNKSDVPLEFARAYSSGSGSDTGLGPGWSQTGLASATQLESGDVLIQRQDGRQDLFFKTGEGSYIAPSGVTSTLAKVEGTFQLTTLENTVYRFDESGRIASITDDHGLKTTYGYDGNGRLATITDPSSQTLTFSYNASNHITSVKDSTSREVKYTYSGAGDLATVTDALGGVTEYTYDAAHHLKTIKDPRGNVILKNTYDGQGRIIEQKDGLENLWKLEYKEDETVVTEPEGGKLTYEFDGQDRVVSETDQLGKTTTTSYDGAGNVDEIVKPGGAKWQFGHDAKGNLTSVIDPEEGERSYEWDGKNRLESFTDEREETWSYEWSEANDLKKITNPAEGETTFTHDAAGLPLTVTDPNENTTTFTYDTRGNRLTAKDALEHTTAFAYNTRNHLTSKTAPGLEPETYGRNAFGDLLSVTTPEGNKTEYAYDANGVPKQITDSAEGVWKIELNAMERPTAYVDPLGKETKVAYDGNLNPVKITDRRGKETTYAYDLANQLTETIRPEGGDWEFGYDARGNRIEAVEPRENATIYDFDLLDRMTEASEPLEVTTEYGYDAGSNLASVTDPRGNTTSYGYDELGRLTEIDQPLEKTTSLTYDPAGNWLTQTSSAGTVELDYDAANRLEEISEGESTLRSYEYDAANRMIGATDAQSDEIEIGYDDDGRVVSLDDGRGQAVSREYESRGNLIEQTDGRGALEYEYDKLGRLEALTDPQGKESSFAYNPEGGVVEVKRPGGIVTSNAYDDAGRLSETTTEAGEPAAVLEALEYDYDQAGNVIKRIDSRLEQETTFAYNDLNRLTEFDPPGEGSMAYGYDAAGNRTSASGITYSYNALNQPTEASDGTSYGYDGAGRLTSIAKGEEETTYEWDALDHLATVEGPGGTASYAYDALDRLSERTAGSGSTITHYGDLTDLPTYDTDGEGETTASYVSGVGGLLEQRSGEATSYPLRDAHGDVTAIADAAGEVTSRPNYDPWGVQLSGPSVEMGYLGAQQRRFDPTSKLIQMGARSYSPTLGRFMTEDPVLGHLGVGTSVNRYAYAWDNPLNLYDLDGLDVCVPTPFGEACAEEAAEDIGNAAGNAAGAAGSAAESAWNWTRPGRAWVSERAQDFAKSDVGKWIDARADELERTFGCIAERVVQQPGPVGCQEEAEQWKPEPESPEVPPSLPPPGVPGKDLIPNMR